MKLFTLKCKYCGSEDIIYSEGEYICTKCGTVLSSCQISQDYFKFQNDYSRGYYKIRYTYGIYKKISSYYINMIEMISEKLGIPGIVKKETENIIRTLLRSNLQSSRRVTTVAVALYLAALRCNFSLCFKDIISAFEELGFYIGKRKLISVLETAKRLGVKFKKRDIENELIFILNKLFSLENVLRKIRKYNLDLYKYKSDLFNQALTLYKNIDKKWLIGKGIRTTAASLIYIAELFLSFNNKRPMVFSQRIISEISGISEYTIRERVIDYYEIHNARDISLRGRRKRSRHHNSITN